MTQFSSAELDSNSSTPADIPLLERPLVADDENTVVSTGLDDSQHSLPDVQLSSSAQEIRERLFAGTDSASSERGLKLGHFEVDEKIGSGGMGAVFRAVDLELSRYVALKVLHPQTAADPALVGRFRNEARACAQLNHDNVARVFFTGDQDGVHYIAYEYADGLTIKQLIDQKGRLTPEETVNYAIQATLALNHINTCGVVHRDIKPSNIILTQAGRIKVVDLGLARRDTTDSIGDLTVAGTTLGTFDYIAPEQARDPHTADTRSDIYSLGCTVYHMLTGQPPYPEGTALQKLLDHQGKSPPDARTLAPDVPAAVSAVVQKMMNTAPEARYQDPGQLLADLIAIAANMGLRSVPAEGVVWRRIPVRRTRELTGTIFLATTVVAICATALVMHFSPSGLDKSDAEMQKILNAMLPAEEPVSPAVTNATVQIADNGPKASGELPLPTDDSTPVSVVADTSNDVPTPTDGSPPVSTSSVSGQLTENVSDGSDTLTVKPPFRVQSVNGKVRTTSTLAEAWADARAGDVIVLDFDGPLSTPTRCLTPRYSESQIITIRAADGRSPVLEFQGEDTNGSVTPGMLFQLSNNLNLKMVGVHLRVNVRPEVVSNEWVLFEFDGANRVELQDCTIEVRNRSRIKTAIFRLSDSRAGITAQQQCAIRLDRCAIRGGCDLVRIAAQSAGQIFVEQSFFALDGSLIDDIGSNAMTLQSSLSVDMKHTSSICSRSAFRMADSDSIDGGAPERTVPNLSINSNSCVYASLKPNGVLVQSDGNYYLDELQELFRWSGSHNFYHQIGSYWRLESGTFDKTPTMLSFDDWQEHWSRITDTQEDDADEFDDSVWITQDRLSGMTPIGLASALPGEFSLNRSSFNFSPGSSNRHRLSKDGSLPGVDPTRLPKFPATAPVSEKANTSGQTASENLP